MDTRPRTAVPGCSRTWRAGPQSLTKLGKPCGQHITALRMRACIPERIRYQLWMTAARAGRVQIEQKSRDSSVVCHRSLRHSRIFTKKLAMKPLTSTRLPD
ncbi:uncharacterized protein PgNI_05056 [Pyricularia grisea]|uniref:Uncharacterized protein n=1 Tax=Pyricularia grisea TaxID=148305 RepID=A0A6P8BDR6_PYRGI|nr:uncharacterized protein PgNI_05056 [Pyricularia grisea]TLD14016.1 hypothetical protein PgNI_05056 [Pyricularia grisea]